MWYCSYARLFLFELENSPKEKNWSGIIIIIYIYIIYIKRYKAVIIEEQWKHFFCISPEANGKKWTRTGLGLHHCMISYHDCQWSQTVWKRERESTLWLTFIINLYMYSADTTVDNTAIHWIESTEKSETSYSLTAFLWNLLCKTHKILSLPSYYLYLS